MNTAIIAFIAFLCVTLQFNSATAIPLPCFLPWMKNHIICKNHSRRLQSNELGTAVEAELNTIRATGEILSVSPEMWVETLEHLAESGVSSREDLEKLVFEETQDDTVDGVLEEVILVAAIWNSISVSVDSNFDGEITIEEWDRAVLENWEGVPLPTTPEVFKNLFKQTQEENKITNDIFAHFFLANVFSGSAQEAGLEAPLPEGAGSGVFEGQYAPIPEGLEAPLP